MEATAERDCSVLGGLFQTIINDMKGSVPVWEDFTSKASKLHTQLKTTIIAVSAFLEAFQRIADIATNSRGATKELGASLTRMCIRHKTIELKLKSFTNAIMECLVTPLQERMEEWKKITTQLDKEHAKDYKKARQEIKKKSSDTMRLQKKARKGKADIQYRLDSAMQDVTDMYLLLEEAEKNAVRGGMIEERSRFCTLISCFKPVVDEEISMLSEVTRLEAVMGELAEQGKEPYVLPQSSEQVILDVKGQDIKWAYQTPPGSPSQSSGSRKSSMCSLSSMTSSDSRSSSSTNSHSPGTNYVRHRSMSQPNSAYRLSSVSSQDSGFTSQDMLFPNQPGTPPQTVQEENAQQVALLHNAPAPYELEHQSSSECSTPSSPTPPTSSSSFTLPPSQASQGFAPPPPSWLLNFSQSEKMQRPKSIPTPITASANRPPPPVVADKPSPKRKNSDSKAGGMTYVPDFNTPQSNQIVPRPVCAGGQQVSNAELYRQRSATLPARRHTHSSMPSAMYSIDTDGNTSSHGSLSNSSGYSSQSTTGTTGSDDMLPSQDGNVDNYNDRSTSGYSNTTESMYRTTPNQSPTRRPMSMACIPTASMGEPANRNTATTPGGSLRKSKPPPPIRRTPSGGSLTGMNIMPDPQIGVLPNQGVVNRGETGDGHCDPSGVFRRPHTPGRVRSQSTVQAPYNSELQQPVAQPQGRVHRSHSLKLAGDVMSGDMARINLMDSLNAKLAQRPQPPRSAQDAGPRQQKQLEQQNYAQQQQQYQQSTQQYQQQIHQQQQHVQYQHQQQYQQDYQQPQYQPQYQDPNQPQPAPYSQYSQSQAGYQPTSPSQQTYPSPPAQNTSQSFQQRQQQVKQQLQQQLQHTLPVQGGQYAAAPQSNQLRQQDAKRGYTSQGEQLQQAAAMQHDDSDSSDSDVGVGILGEIKKGVKLKRTFSNDRSAPRI